MTTKDDGKIEGQKLGPRRTAKTEEDDTYDGIMDRALTNYKKIGFAMVPKPDGTEPRLPRDIASLTFEQNSNLHGEFVRWSEFAEQQKALWDGTVSVGEEKLDYVDRVHKMSYDGNATERVDFAKTDPQHVEINTKLLEARVTASLVQSKCVYFERGRAALSRDVNRHVQEHESNRREGGIGRAGVKRSTRPFKE